MASTPRRIKLTEKALAAERDIERVECVSCVSGVFVWLCVQCVWKLKPKYQNPSLASKKNHSISEKNCSIGSGREREKTEQSKKELQLHLHVTG